MLHAYGIVAITELKEPAFHGALLCLVPFPSLFYLITVKYTDPVKIKAENQYWSIRLKIVCCILVRFSKLCDEGGDGHTANRQRYFKSRKRHTLKMLQFSYLSAWLKSFVSTNKFGIEKVSIETADELNCRSEFSHYTVSCRIERKQVNGMWSRRFKNSYFNAVAAFK